MLNSTKISSEVAGDGQTKMEWSKPEITELETNDGTLGTGDGGADGGSHFITPMS